MLFLHTKLFLWGLGQSTVKVVYWKVSEYITFRWWEEINHVSICGLIKFILVKVVYWAVYYKTTVSIESNSSSNKYQNLLFCSIDKLILSFSYASRLVSKTTTHFSQQYCLQHLGTCKYLTSRNSKLLKFCFSLKRWFVQRHTYTQLLRKFIKSLNH